MSTDRHITTVLSIALAAFLSTSPAVAFVNDFTIASMSPGTIVIDGSADDWYDAEYPCLELGKNSIVWGASSCEGKTDLGLLACLAYDDANVYLMLDVSDDRQVRTKKPTPQEDHVEIWVEQIIEGQPVHTEIHFYPERKFPTFHPALKMITGADPKMKPIKGAKFSMQSGSGGWVAEIVLPMSSIEVLDTGLVASKWAIVAIDSDTATGDPARETVMATSGVLGVDDFTHEAVSTMQVTMEKVESVLQAFLKDQEIEGKPMSILFADVAEDAHLEAVVKAFPLVGILGPGFMSSESYSFIELPVFSASDVTSLEARDVSGDGKADIIVRHTERNELGSRDMISVYSFVASDLRKILVQELSVKQKSKYVSCSASFLPGGPGGSEMLLVTDAMASGWSEVTYKNLPEYGVGAVLTPWGVEERRLWAMQGLEFKPVKTDEIDAMLDKSSSTAKAKKPKKAKKTSKPKKK